MVFLLISLYFYWYLFYKHRIYYGHSSFLNSMPKEEIYYVLGFLYNYIHRSILLSL